MLQFEFDRLIDEAKEEDYEIFQKLCSLRSMKSRCDDSRSNTKKLRMAFNEAMSIAEHLVYDGTNDPMNFEGTAEEWCEKAVNAGNQWMGNIPEPVGARQ